ncbi:acyl carrier protein [Lacticaseibacillus thailandensis]|uniref:Acyl carrier protein n=1 Tax=Lacticaseibacillus thailandensis DSM 22698 = JCM 13996 TaxID=1423810 RepID=A0A0R2CD25_9LACO|nr:acyl carrier protein [Lacticaseibacillus thailandensis]KRM87892.1 hypothetical protein FD19_GL000170 [Lacticaseibacillus thailandensis DSM 22698 = JCM 13996]
MTKDAIITKIMDMVQADGVAADKQVTPTMSFKNDLNLDSLDIFELVNEIEDEFDIEIEADESIDTIDALAAYVQTKLPDQAEA